MGREGRFSLRAALVTLAVVAVLLALARWLDPLLVAGTLIGGGLGAMIDAALRRRLTSVWIALGFWSLGAVFLVSRIAG